MYKLDGKLISLADAAAELVRRGFKTARLDGRPVIAKYDNCGDILYIDRFPGFVPLHNAIFAEVQAVK